MRSQTQGAKGKEPSAKSKPDGPRLESHKMVTRDGQICDICDKPAKLHVNGKWSKPESNPS